MQQLTQVDYNNLKGKGFSDAEIQSAIKEVEQEELMLSKGMAVGQGARDPRYNSQMSSFQTPRDDNLIKWQLELNDILERAEHILRGDRPHFENGHLIWKPNENMKDNPLNETGVQEVLKILAMYVNRNTILADYSNEEINFKVFDFGRELNNYFFMRYEELGMDTEDKRKSYGIIIREMVDIVHSSYKRALEGGERRSLREMIQVSQTHTTQSVAGQPMNVATGQPMHERSVLNPMRYLGGKYK
jgi:hypothetical protein